MAQVSSGSFVTTSSQNRSLTFNWSVDSTSISNNRTNIYWSVTGSGSSTGYVMAGNFKVVIDGETVYEKGQDYRIELRQNTLVASGYKMLYHNDIGNKSFSASVEAGIYTFARNVSGSGSWELPIIPRYVNISNFTVTPVDETTVRYDWVADAICDYAWYSIDNGVIWHDLPNTQLVGGLSPNTSYNFLLKLRRTDSQLTTDSPIYTQRTYDYPHCTSSPNFIIGNAVTLEFYNPLNRNISVKLLGNGDADIGSWTGTGTSVTGFNDTANSQYESIPNATSAKYKVQVTYNGVTRTRDNDNTYSVNSANCIPTFNNFTYKDTNTTVTEVTGNDQVLVKGLSNLQVTISSANKMVAKNGANGSKYIITIDTVNKSVNYSTSDIDLAVGTLINSGTKRLMVTAYDTRTISKAVYKDITVYDYTKPVINATIKRLNNFENETTIKVSGTYTRLTIDGADKNTISNVQYRYRETDGTWGGWTTLSTTVTSGKFTCSDVVLSLDNTKSFEFEIQAVDKLQTNTSSINVDIGQAIFFVSTNKKACYINGELIKLGYREPALLVNGDYNTMCSLDSGFYKSTSVTNAPYTQPDQDETSNWFFIIHIAHSENYQMQIASPFFEEGLYFRHNLNGDWGTWKKLSYTEVT